MLPRARQMYDAVKAAHEGAFRLMLELRQQLKGQPIGELVDLVYALDRSEKLADDLRKELKAMREQLDKVVCVMWVTADCSEPVRTKFCTGTPTMKQTAPLPNRHRNPENFKKLMDSIGVPQELWDVNDEEHAAVSISWPGMLDLISNRLAQGMPVPPGVDPNATFTVYRVSLRKLRDVDDDDGDYDKGDQDVE